MSNEPRDPDSDGVDDTGSEPGEQTPVDDGTGQSPLVDDVTAQSGDDTAPATESLTDTDVESQVDSDAESQVDSDTDVESPAVESPADSDTDVESPAVESPADSDEDVESPAVESAIDSDEDVESPVVESPDATAETDSSQTGPEMGSPDPAGTGASSFDGDRFGPPDDRRSEPNGPGFTPPPQPGPIYQAPPPVRRLTRDPYSRLGGVASGIAHYYGIDVSLVRLAIVAFAVMTGIGFLLYFVAWLVIPRAQEWPPPPPPGGYRSGRMDNRQMALGLIALGLLIAVFAGGGAGTRVLIALGLIAAGIWIFNQRPAPTGSPNMAPGPEPVPPVTPDMSVATPSTPSASTASDPTGQWSSDPGQWSSDPGQWSSDATTRSFSDSTGDRSGYEPPSTGAGGYEPSQTVYQATAYPPPQLVPPRRRRIWPFVVIGVLLVAPIMAIGGAVAVFVALEGGDVSFSTDGSGRYQVNADTPAEIPNRIREGTGELEIDFSDLEIEDFADEDAPIPVEVDMTAGQIVIELPDDLPVDVNADIGAAGSIQVFDSSREGFRPEYSFSEPDAVLELDVHIGAGEILIER